MRKVHISNKTGISINQSYEGEPIEIMIRRITENKEPIETTSPIIYTERKDGVQPQYDIRTDRWEVAREAMDRIHREAIAKRDSTPGNRSEVNAAGESIQATE